MSNVTHLRANMPAVALPEPTDKWLSPEEVCELLPGMTVEKLKGMRYRGIGPRFYKPTLKTVVYLKSEIDAYVLSTLPSHWRGD